MKLSQLIKHAQVLQAASGDLEVGTFQDLGLFSPVVSINGHRASRSKTKAFIYSNLNGKKTVAIIKTAP